MQSAVPGMAPTALRHSARWVTMRGRAAGRRVKKGPRSTLAAGQIASFKFGGSLRWKHWPNGEEDMWRYWWGESTAIGDWTVEVVDEILDDFRGQSFTPNLDGCCLRLTAL